MSKCFYLVHKGSAITDQSLFGRDSTTFKYGLTQHIISVLNCSGDSPTESKAYFRCATCGNNIPVSITWKTIFFVSAESIYYVFQKKDASYHELKSRIYSFDSTFPFVSNFIAALFVFFIFVIDDVPQRLFVGTIAILIVLMSNILGFYLFYSRINKNIFKYAFLGEMKRKPFFLETNRMKRNTLELKKIPGILFIQIPIKIWVENNEQHFITTDSQQIASGSFWINDSAFHLDLPFNKFITKKYSTSVEEILGLDVQ